MVMKFTWACKLCQKLKLTSKKSKTGYCRNCFAIATQQGIKRPQFSGTNSKRWNGGEYISSDGYKMIKVDGSFSERGRQIYKKEHVMIYEQYLGRELLTEKGGNGESVHHINGNKLDNRIENLILCNGSSEHRNLHCQLEEIAFELVRSGKIIFNKDNMKYAIVS